MKKIFALLIAINAVVLGYSQEEQRTGLRSMQSLEPQTAEHTSEELVRRIRSVNHQIAQLKSDIITEYQGYNKDKLYTDENARNADFNKLEKEKTSLRNQIKEIDQSIQSLNDEYQAVERIREYYEKGNIDTLFNHTDLLSLQIHKKIFGAEYPKVMDELLILLECAGLLKQEYNLMRKSSGRKRLKDVQQCKTKEYLDGLLSIQEDITNEVSSWIKDEEHTFYDIVLFRNYLYNNYAISFDVDFPYLYKKIIERIELLPQK